MTNTTKAIVEQLGGWGIRAMINARDFAEGCGALRFTFSGCRKASVAVVRLTPADTYTVEFYKRGEIVPVKEFSEVYCDTLRGVFESFTGLRTRLFN